MRKRCNRRLLGIGVAVLAVLPPGVFPTKSVAGPTPQPLTISSSGSNGAGRIVDPGRRCADGGSGQYRHVGIDSALPTPPTSPNAVISANLPGFIRGSFDVHHDGDEVVGQPITPAANQAFLQGTESHVTLSNQRGSVQLRLTSGTCAAPTLSFDGTTVAGTGSWTIDPNSTTGSYHPTAPNPSTGSGTFTLSMGVAPGADNLWALTLNGDITVPQPKLKVEVASTSWGNLGVDYVTRRVTVVYRVTNIGTGDAFDTVATEASTTTPGVKAMGPVPQKLGDLAHGESTTFTVRYQFSLIELSLNVGTTIVGQGLIGGPCTLVILNCTFSTKVSVSMPDVLDKADVPAPSQTLQVTAPTFPPPL